MHLWCVLPSSHEKNFSVQDHTTTTYVVRVKPEDKFYHPIIMASIEPKINFFYVKWWQWYQKRSMYCFEISLYVPVALHKWYLYNLYRRPINLFRTIEVWYYVCLCALTGEILIALVCQIFASCVTSKARKFCCSSSCNMTVSSFQI